MGYILCGYINVITKKIKNILDVKGMFQMNQAEIEQKDALKRLHIKIGGMQCSFCVETIKKAYKRIDGVSDVGVNLSHEEALITYNPYKISETKIKDVLRSLGFVVKDPTKLHEFEQERSELHQQQRQLFVAAIITFISLILMSLMWLGIRQSWFPILMLVLTLIMIFVVGRQILKMAYASLRRGILNQHVLMEFGAFGGLLGGLVGFFVQPWPIADFMGAAIFITTYHILSGYVSSVVRIRSSQAIKKLMALQPNTARIIKGNNEEEVPIERVKVGDLVLVKPGESIPIDGVVVKGEASVDQSLITGEPLPVFKGVGDEVIGGAIVKQGTLFIKVTRVGTESFLSQVIRAVQEARTLKPGILLLVEKILKVFVPGVLFFAGLAFVIWTIGTMIVVGEPNFRRAIFSTLAVLVMGYPCALGMATPLAMIRGGGIAAEKGILMRSGEAFQIFKDVKTIVFDKTGTITIGKPQVVKVFPLNDFDEQTIVRVAAAAEFSSEHPLAGAIVSYAKKTGVLGLNEVPKFSNFKNYTGRGVEAIIDSKKILVGSFRFLKEKNIDVTPVEDMIVEGNAQGWTLVGVAGENQLIGIIAFSDTIRPEAKRVVQRFKEIGITSVMVTGDRQQTAQAIAQAVGIDEIKAEMLPQQKAQYIRTLQKKGIRVAMIGDGINDAPALMQADIGIAIGSGVDIAIEAADIILTTSNLEAIIDAFYISKKSYRKTQQNVFLAFAFNGLGIPLATLGLLHPIAAMIAMVASVTTILVNSFAGRFLPKSVLTKGIKT